MRSRSKKAEPVILKKGKELTAWKNANTPDECPLCGRSMKSFLPKNRTVDHDHETGRIRGVLCRNCNGLDGRVLGLAIRAGQSTTPIRWLRNLLNYWIDAVENPLDVYYPGTTVQNGKVVPPPKAKRKRKNRRS